MPCIQLRDLSVLALGGFALGCPPPEPEPEPEPYATVIEEEDSGVMLAAWSDGDELLMVGGRLSPSPMNEAGGPGHLVRVSESGACVERDIADRTLWWIDGPAPGEWYAVGERGTIVHEVDGMRSDESVATQGTLYGCLLYTSPSPRDGSISRMPSSA